MRKTAVAVALAIVSSSSAVLACTTFCLRQDGSVVYGRNYDFDIGTGVVVINQRGVQKRSLAETLSWVSAYGSVTFNQFGREYPLDGMNEAGLVIGLMWLDGTVYPAEDSRPVLGVLQWIQYQLDRYGSVSEVLAHAEEIRVRGGTPIHYLIADAGGDSATLEYLGGALVVHRGSTLPVTALANDSYDSSLQYLRQFSGFGGSRGMPGGPASLDRFARAAMLLARPGGGQSAVDRTLDILGSVAQPGWTRWSVAYDATRREVTWRTDVTPERKVLRLASLDFSCASAVKSIDVRSTRSGDAGAALATLSAEANLARMIDAYASTTLIGPVSRDSIEYYAAHAQSFACLPTPPRSRAVRK